MRCRGTKIYEVVWVHCNCGLVIMGGNNSRVCVGGKVKGDIWQGSNEGNGHEFAGVELGPCYVNEEVDTDGDEGKIEDEDKRVFLREETGESVCNGRGERGVKEQSVEAGEEVWEGVPEESVRVAYGSLAKACELTKQGNGYEDSDREDYPR